MLLATIVFSIKPGRTVEVKNALSAAISKTVLRGNLLGCFATEIGEVNTDTMFFEITELEKDLPSLREWLRTTRTKELDKFLRSVVMEVLTCEQSIAVPHRLSHHSVNALLLQEFDGEVSASIGEGDIQLTSLTGQSARVLTLSICESEDEVMQRALQGSGSSRLNSAMLLPLAL